MDDLVENGNEYYYVVGAISAAAVYVLAPLRE